ncbi:uncharacterized protein MONOS_4541 [Monocercomonoides exilis]|uniref:uncharacterized protein n=1 Tax=Monocercomonoides exilis TaxID=2049356 RepID=UPI003559EFD1|nr:hypothetical protein MONOS_4541 [Monocercomonoides exilis]|eukprot:MONOS_4541.1-p1 / transcript=MONOS_4541.1 / gene=MONOS_4541 / organism=Monocercomonoides_exilis_PA203 / gene_product=unspecified product / transcript_product=unspecified product / location=Mono_scaffold00122:6022-6279(-) / protein_length=86 / sequence_SO=supercontig / SO=protein_coding / is_pseudo=false
MVLESAAEKKIKMFFGEFEKILSKMGVVNVSAFLGLMLNFRGISSEAERGDENSVRCHMRWQSTDFIVFSNIIFIWCGFLMQCER